MRKLMMIQISALILSVLPLTHASSLSFGFYSPNVSIGYGFQFWYDSGHYGTHTNLIDLDFRVALGGHGEWIYLPAHGSVWVPYVDIGWRPYSCGYWSWSTYGWTWIAYEPWGWIPHHYGRWIWDSGYGWVWIPGYTWGPAWVTWRTSSRYIGWAPLPPRGYYYSNQSRGYQRYHWQGHSSRTGHLAYPFELQAGYWTMVEKKSFGNKNIVSVALPDHTLEKIFSNQRFTNSDSAPGRKNMEAVTGQHFHETKMTVTKARTDNRTYNLIRPDNVMHNVRQHAPDVEKAYMKSSRIKHPSPANSSRINLPGKDGSGRLVTPNRSRTVLPNSKSRKNSEAKRANGNLKSEASSNSRNTMNRVNNDLPGPNSVRPQRNNSLTRVKSPKRSVPSPNSVVPPKGTRLDTQSHSTSLDKKRSNSPALNKTPDKSKKNTKKSLANKKKNINNNNLQNNEKKTQ